MRAKIYNHRADILKDMRLARARKVKLIEKAAALDLQATDAILAGSSGIVIKNLREDAEKLRQQAARIESVRLKQLLNTLQVYDTEPMPFMEGDRTTKRQNL